MSNSRQLAAMLAAVITGSYLLLGNTGGIAALFAVLMVAGTLIMSLASLYRSDVRNGFYPLLATLVLSLVTMLTAKTGLEFFFAWELMTLSSYFLISLSQDKNHAGVKASLSFLMFSLFSAYCLLAGFGVAYDATGSVVLSSLGNMSNGSVAQTTVFILFALAFFIKVAGFGLHVWLPGAYGEADDDFSAILSAVVSKAGVYGLIITAAYLGVYANTGYEPAYLLGWAGILTATFGAMMAVFQEDIKLTLAYSSMGQLGYIITGIALMSHLGWVAALYMTVNHFLFKSILFLSAAGIIMRTDTRLMYKMGGLIKNMPVTFVFVMIAIIAMSGVPPLSGYGGKWLLFNALMDKGWHFIAAFAFFSSAVAFLYMFRILHTVFLGQRKLEHRELREAPLVLLIPQAIMIGTIMFISAYPKLLLDTVSAAITPWLGGGLVWDGLALQTHYGYWNAPMIMIVVAAVWMVPLIILLLASLTMKIQKVEQFNIVYAAERPHRPEDTHFAYNFFAHYDRAVGFLVRPRASTFWNGVGDWSHLLGSSLRIFYNGNGQTYALFILIYLVAIFLANGGLN
jgi:formate hydrogenlyase subunit 3/multisubunit Na+/H+ antiporter MnhD subunit